MKSFIKYLSNIIKKLINSIHKTSDIQKIPEVEPIHIHRWYISVPCPDRHKGCQVEHFDFLSEDEALKRSKSINVYCWDCRKKYN